MTEKRNHNSKGGILGPIGEISDFLLEFQGFDDQDSMVTILTIISLRAGTKPD